MDHGIWYSRKPNLSHEGMLYGYYDADIANCLDERRSVSAHVFMLGSGAIAGSLKI